MSPIYNHVHVLPVHTCTHREKLMNGYGQPTVNMYNIDLDVMGKHWWMNVHLCYTDLGVGGRRWWMNGQQEGNTLHNRWTEGWIILSLPPPGSCLFGCYRCTECFVVYILIFDMIRTQVIIKTLTTRNSYCHTDLDTVIELLSNMLSLHHYLMMKMNLWIGRDEIF